ncbi:MAG: tol-pal system YbgF family protein [Saprospiraceae bacterium]
MKNSNEINFQRLISQYVLGRISNDDKKILEKAIAEDDDLKNDLQFSINLKDAIEIKEAERIRMDVLELTKDIELTPDYDGLEEFLGTESNQPQEVNTPQYTLYVLYGVLVVFILVIGYFVVSNLSNNPVNIEGNIQKRLENIPVFEMIISLDDELLNQATKDLKNNQFDKASEGFNNYYNIKKDDMILVYIGITELKLGNTEKAKQIFSRLSDVDGSLMQDISYLYLGYTHYADGDRKTFENIVDSLSSKNTLIDNYVNNAKGILYQEN